MNPLLSRKFIAAIVSLVSLTVLCWFDKIADGVYATGLVSTMGAYLTANVTQKLNAKKE